MSTNDNITFGSAEIPERKRGGRKPLPNPFVGVFPSDDRAATLTVEHPKDSKEVRRLVRQARIAANAVDRSPQVQAVEAMNADGSIQTEMTVWTVDKITRG